MKISQKLKRSLASKKDLRRSGEITSEAFVSTKQPINMTLLGNILEIMGVDDESRGDIIQQVENILPDRSPTDTQLSSYKTKILNKVVETVNSLSDEQKKHRAATLIQSIYRTVQLRKRIKHLGLIFFNKLRTHLIFFEKQNIDYKKIGGYNTAVYSLYVQEKKYVEVLTEMQEVSLFCSTVSFRFIV